MLQFEELKLQLNALKEQIEDLGDAIGIEHLKEEAEKYDIQSAQPAFGTMWKLPKR